nr:MAG TPA: hypothetical protein [Caudoviricetes sp.]
MQWWVCSRASCCLNHIMDSQYRSDASHQYTA